MRPISGWDMYFLAKGLHTPVVRPLLDLLGFAPSHVEAIRDQAKAVRDLCSPLTYRASPLGSVPELVTYLGLARPQEEARALADLLMLATSYCERARGDDALQRLLWTSKVLRPHNEALQVIPGASDVGAAAIRSLGKLYTSLFYDPLSEVIQDYDSEDLDLVNAVSVVGNLIHDRYFVEFCRSVKASCSEADIRALEVLASSLAGQELRLAT
jgi:hypothetical protein